MKAWMFYALLSLVWLSAAIYGNHTGASGVVMFLLGVFSAGNVMKAVLLFTDASTGNSV